MEAELKKTLKAVTLELRRRLEGRYDQGGQWKPGDLEQRLAASGVRRERASVPVDELMHLAEEDRQARKVVDAYVKLRHEAGVERAEAVAEFVRETAYTWANRLLALRCMEARDLIDSVICSRKPTAGGPWSIIASPRGARSFVPATTAAYLLCSTRVFVPRPSDCRCYSTRRLPASRSAPRPPR